MGPRGQYSRFAASDSPGPKTPGFDTPYSALNFAATADAIRHGRVKQAKQGRVAGRAPPLPRLPRANFCLTYIPVAGPAWASQPIEGVVIVSGVLTATVGAPLPTPRAPLTLPIDHAVAWPWRVRDTGTPAATRQARRQARRQATTRAGQGARVKVTAQTLLALRQPAAEALPAVFRNGTASPSRTM